MPLHIITQHQKQARIEDDVIINSTGAELMTQVPRTVSDCVIANNEGIYFVIYNILFNEVYL